MDQQHFFFLLRNKLKFRILLFEVKGLDLFFLREGSVCKFLRTSLEREFNIIVVVLAALYLNSKGPYIDRDLSIVRLHIIYRIPTGSNIASNCGASERALYQVYLHVHIVLLCDVGRKDGRTSRFFSGLSVIGNFKGMRVKGQFAFRDKLCSRKLDKSIDMIEFLKISKFPFLVGKNLENEQEEILVL